MGPMVDIKKLPGTYLDIFTNNIWSYELWSPVIGRPLESQGLSEAALDSDLFTARVQKAPPVCMVLLFGRSESKNIHKGKKKKTHTHTYKHPHTQENQTSHPAIRDARFFRRVDGCPYPPHLEKQDAYSLIAEDKSRKKKSSARTLKNKLSYVLLRLSRFFSFPD